jgi:hypothetical protein
MKVRYITEGVFKNPTQARETREKQKELTNVEKVSGLYNNLYAAAKHRVITTEFMEYFTNYGKALDNERFWEVVNYTWYLAPFFKGQNCVDMGKYPDAKPIPGFNESLRVDYVCDDEEKMITVTPRYSFRLPEDWKAPSLSCSSTKNSFKLTDTSWKIPTSSIEKDMIIRVQTSIGKKLAAETEKNRTMDSVVRKDLQKYQFKLGKIVLFDKINEDVVLNMRVAYPDIVEDPSIRGDGFIPMIENLLERYSFGCKRFILTYDDMYGITHQAGSAYESSPAAKEQLKYATMINDFGIDSYKLFEFLIKWNCISGAGGIEHAMKFYQRKYNRTGVEVFYKRYYNFVIEHDTLVDKNYGSLLPLTGPAVAPISVEFYGVEMIYAYYGKNNMKLNKVFGYTDNIHMLVDDMKISDDYTEDDELVIGWLNQIGERIAKIIGASNES